MIGRLRRDGRGGQGAFSRRCWRRRSRTCCASSDRTAWACCRPISVSTPVSRLTAVPGGIAFVSQSGAISRPFSIGRARGIGFSHFVSLGDIRGRRFRRHARLTSPRTDTRDPDVRRSHQARAQIHVGGASRGAQQTRHRRQGGPAPEGAKAAARTPVPWQDRTTSTTPPSGVPGICGSAPERPVWRGRDAGVRDAAVGERIVILTNGGGPGVLAADAVCPGGAQLASLSDATCPAQRRVAGDLVARQSGGHHRRRPDRAMWIASGSSPRTRKPMPSCSSVRSRSPIVDSTASRLRARRCCEIGMPVFSCWLGGNASRERDRLFVGAGLPTYETPEQTRCVPSWYALSPQPRDVVRNTPWRGGRVVPDEPPRPR